jgi:valyl-tRNA synthetase
VRVIYEKKIDVAAERERLTKELERLEKELASGKSRLENEQFRSNAPAPVVDGVRKRVQELEILVAQIRKRLEELG